MAEIITSGQVVPKITEGLHLMDGIEGLRSLPRHSVDMLLTDPPYGTTKNYWDTPLPLPELTTMSRFHKYSLNNVMLIHSQRPDATLVAGFNKWKNSFGRHVKKGEKGIQILAPTPYKIKVEKEMH